MSNEISFSYGSVFVPKVVDNPVYSSAKFVAKTGMGMQVDYKLMSTYLGFQIAINYIINPYDDSFASDVMNAVSVDADSWLTLMGMVKIVGRTPAISNKIIFDFNMGFGLIHGNFSNQIFKYASSYNNLLSLDQIYGSEKRTTGFVLSTGVKMNYKFNNNIGVFASFNLLLANQNHTLNYVRIGPGISSRQRATTVKKNYFPLLFGVTSYF
jgi:hypothetical protein